MEVEGPTFLAEEFSFDTCTSLSKRKEATGIRILSLNSPILPMIDPLLHDPVFGGEVTTALKKQISSMQTKLNEISILVVFT